MNFSPRKDGNCGRIGHYLASFYNRTNVLSFDIDCAPCGNCDYECLKPGEHCPKINRQLQDIAEAVSSADMAYFIVPNFCGYPCANYLAFNERMVGVFSADRESKKQYMAVKKRFIVVSNTEGDSFRNALQQQTNEEPRILYLKSSKYKKRSIAGDILDSEEALADLNAFLNAD